MASTLEKAKVGALGFISLAVLVVLVLSIITFVNVNNDEKSVPTAAPTTTLAPVTEPADSVLHIRPRKKIQPDLDNIEKFAYYKSYSETLKGSLNTTYDPCDNFYEYAFQECDPFAERIEEK
ncbi:unnamed protein product [Bursaphelenchus xylophilus]|uniref:(pine wood nematode) hypothetical protein n=1 Tax=Bursaphelenchus xylophilus TaxID=6326 RepID=A0A1I7RW01_BURXY|nr:unnamed protein product [Bursaphelenchus xylophilus]CAG9094946.1 unnamed protein product [Bursaphelenchus xylophilus]